MYCDRARWSSSVRSAWMKACGCGTDIAVRVRTRSGWRAVSCQDDGGAPVVADDVGLLDPERVEDPEGVADQLGHRVAVGVVPGE